MPSETKPLLTTQTEKPNHYSYLKEFRVDQCPLFLQHKCTQHRPYTCFHWHFMNQRRRRPVRKRDGSFNYSADTYCQKFDETTGVCPEGDECPFLHRTAGDTERRYHLRYYKTCMCVHDTDSRGFCVKNGPHCAFAHGDHDLRPPVYDIKELQALESQEGDGSALNGPNVLDKERNLLLNEDPKWQDSGYVLANYKTEQCKRPPRLCRQGYACPQYHNIKDKRRHPKKFKYRSTPCPNVKHNDEWGEPSNCEAGDNCGYCHTRTEQQFHPEIYKSTKCHDVHNNGYCPRGAFCAFAHVDQEMSSNREEISSGTNFGDILANAFGPDTAKKEETKSDSSVSFSNNGSGEVSESASVSSIGSNSSSKAPGAQLSNSKIHSIFNNHLQNNHDMFSNNILQQMKLEQSESNQRTGVFFPSGHSNGLLGNFYSTDNGVVESVLGKALDESEGQLILSSFDKDIDADSPVLSGSISAGLANSGSLGGSDPVNIPGGRLPERNNSGLNFSPNASSPLNHMGFLGSRFSQDTLDTISNNWQSSLQPKMNRFGSGGMYDYNPISPHHNVSHSPLGPFLNNSPSESQNQKYAKEIQKYRQKITILEQLVAEKSEMENKQKSYSTPRRADYKGMSISQMTQIQSKLRGDLEAIEQAILHKKGQMCMVCEEQLRTECLPCNHLVLCATCSPVQKECPYCQAPLTLNSNHVM